MKWQASNNLKLLEENKTGGGREIIISSFPGHIIQLEIPSALYD